MSETLEVATRHTDASNVVQELARSAEDGSLCLTADHSIAAGEWVRFAVLLRDRSPVLEGVGRCDRVERAAPSAHRVHLSQLQFDARNEVMYERILLARDEGPATGKVDITDIAARAERAPSSPSKRASPPSKPAPPSRPLPRASSIPPPSRPLAPSKPPETSAEGGAGPERPRTPTPPPPRSSPPPLPRPGAARAPSSVPPASGRSTPPPKSPAPVAATRPEARPATGRPPSGALPPRTSERPPARDGASASRPPPASRALAEQARSERSEPTPGRRPSRQRAPLRVPLSEPPDEVPTFDTVVSRPADLTFGREQPMRLEIAADLVARARALAPTLPEGVIDAGRARTSPAETVLRAAVRLGLAALAALADVDDEP